MPHRVTDLASPGTSLSFTTKTIADVDSGAVDVTDDTQADLVGGVIVVAIRGTQEKDSRSTNVVHYFEQQAIILDNIFPTNHAVSNGNARVKIKKLFGQARGTNEHAVDVHLAVITNMTCTHNHAAVANLSNHDQPGDDSEE
jgi:hypothetical protein